MNTEQKTQTQQIKEPEEIKPVREEYEKSIYLIVSDGVIRLVWRGEYKVMLDGYNKYISFVHVRTIDVQEEFKTFDEFRANVLDALDKLEAKAMFEAGHAVIESVKILETFRDLEKFVKVDANVIKHIARKVLYWVYSVDVHYT